MIGNLHTNKIRTKDIKFYVVFVQVHHQIISPSPRTTKSFIHSLLFTFQLPKAKLDATDQL